MNHSDTLSRSPRITGSKCTKRKGIAFYSGRIFFAHKRMAKDIRLRSWWWCTGPNPRRGNIVAKFSSGLTADNRTGSWPKDRKKNPSENRPIGRSCVCGLLCWTISLAGECLKDTFSYRLPLLAARLVRAFRKFKWLLMPLSWRPINFVQ